MQPTTEDARALIRAAQEIHVERHGVQTFLPGTRLSFLEAAKRTGIRPDRQRYHDAIEDLELVSPGVSCAHVPLDGALVHYLITRRGLEGAG